MNQNNVIINKPIKNKKGIDFKKFFILTSMLLKDKMKISFKANFKRSLIKIISLVCMFIIFCALSYIFYYVSILLNIFSVLKYIPVSIPSIIMSVLLILGFISLTISITKTLYFSKDNQIMITYPCNGNTIFFARLNVCFIHEYIKNITIQIPLLIGYMIALSIPLYLIIYLFISFFFITLLEVLFASLLSIPVYYGMILLNKYSLLKIILTIILYGIIISIGINLILLIPENIDIFTNWGPYFTQIQKFLNGYVKYLPGLYYLTSFVLGKLNGFSYSFFSFEGLYTFLVIFGLSSIFFIITLFVINPIYFKLTSSSFEVEQKSKLKNKNNKKMPYFLSQLKKEFLLFKQGNSFIFSILGNFIALPIIILLINKVFGAMDTNVKGDIFVQVINLLIILLISLNSNSIIATIYSKEGEAFKLDKTYPKKGYFLLTSKLIFPMIIGIISIFLSCYFFSKYFINNTTYLVILWICISLVYIAHLLYSAQLDFSKITSIFVEDGYTSKAVKSSTLNAFIVPFVLSVLFYLFLLDGDISAYYRLLIFAVLYFVFNLIYYLYKIKLVYKEGD